MTKTMVEDLKWRIILLYNDGYSKKYIARLLYIGIVLVKKVIHIQYMLSGGVLLTHGVVYQKKKRFLAEMI